MVVDDNADMREYLTRLLRPHHAVRAVSDGMAALAAARDDPPDLVVSDVMMPGLGGMTLLAALRADPRTTRLPVLLLSARAGREAAVEGSRHAPSRPPGCRTWWRSRLSSRGRAVLVGPDALASVRRCRAAGIPTSGTFVG